MEVSEYEKTMIFTVVVSFLMALTILFLPFESEAGNIERVSVDSSGAEGNSASHMPSISPGGRYVAFHSSATNLVMGDTNGYNDVFVYDRNPDILERVSVDNTGVQGDEHSEGSSISLDGRNVAFLSHATNLVTGDTNNSGDVFVSYTVTAHTAPGGGGGGGSSGGCFISTCGIFE